MANTFSAATNTWTCDSVGELTRERVKVKHIRWDAGVSSGAHDRAVVQSNEHRVDGSIRNDTIFGSTADGPDFNDQMLYEDWVNGLQVETLEAGLLYIHLG